MKKRFFLLAIVFFIIIAVKANAMEVVDLLDRHVSINHKVSRIVAIGPGTLRLICYMDLANNVVGIENIEKKSTAPYMIANQQLLKLPVIGQGGPNSSINIEKILSVKPDVIFVTYLVDKKSAQMLQDKTHLPVVVLSYGQIATFNNDDFKKSLLLIGQICNKQDRAKQIISFLDKQFNYIKEISLNKPKVSAYIGALGMRGAHGIESTQSNFLPFELLGVHNVIQNVKSQGAIMVSKEEILKLNPQYILIDLGGLALVEKDYKKNPQFYKSLSAFRNHNVYVEWPYNFYATNIDNALIDTYFIANVVYKQNYNIKQIADEIYKFLLNKPLYDKMLKVYKRNLGKLNF
ncbi:iron ABC transporter substrate-binding protein [Desulfurella sp.]|uniref:iron ABC transporter substrate-binding protein n=1 Tax=Desulfurella sp. TaxID=1962857 RepID=UPI003D0DDA69